MTSHVALLAAELALSGGVLLLLFGLRRGIGLAPLHRAIGAFQHLQVVQAASVIVPITGTLYVNPGSAVLFPSPYSPCC